MCGHDVFQSFQISFDNATLFATFLATLFPEGDATFLAEFDEGFSFVFFVPFKNKHVNNLAFVVGKIVSHNIIFQAVVDGHTD